MLTQLGSLDLIVLVGVMLISLAIGVWSGRKNKDAESYLVGGRSLPWWAILGSIVATETSTATVLSLPGDAYSGAGFRWLQFTFGLVIGRVVVVKYLLPLYFQGQLLTAYQILDERLGKLIKTAASLLFLLTRNIGDGLRLYLAAVVLQALLGWSLGASVFVMGIVTILYTTIGGLRSVVWNDCVQFVIYMIGGVAAVFILVDLVPGGFAAITHFANESGRMVIFDLQFDLSEPLNVWGGVLGGAVLTIGTHGTDQIMVQRYLGARSERDAGRAVVLSAFVVMAQFALFLWIGVALAAFFDQSHSVAPEAADKVFAYFIVNHFPQNVGLIGLMLAAILAAAMSTLSSSLSASSSALLNDFYFPLRSKWNLPTPKSGQVLKTTRLMTVGFGCLQMLIAIWASQWDSTVVTSALKIAGFSAGLLLGVFGLGVFRPGISQRSVLVGASVATAILVWLSFWLKNAAGEAMVAWTYLATIGASTTYLVALVSEALTGTGDQATSTGKTE
ncbi:sodium/solute symporter [Stieleria sp. JC731]|uniref:sodium:solute symporter family transporter n=1 Tax=Pirellulaceae TaxID=2691357 RepID=UPI001E3D20A2|nr:sodium/solute symporter [Stieleria sp. JC731]MCC9599140.1 sodium/solute symporter [Stieleria sp. JC731]